MLLKRYFNAPLKVIYGFRGVNDGKLALQRGEVNATCGMLESTVRSVFLSEYKSGDLNIFVQFGPERAVPFFGSATRLYDRARNDQDRLIFDVIFKQAQLSRPFAAPPGVPPDHIAILRKAMIETARDPQLIADAARVNIEYNPVPGEEAHDIFASYGSIPAEAIKAARDLIEAE
jgi:hypothetical protein